MCYSRVIGVDPGSKFVGLAVLDRNEDDDNWTISESHTLPMNGDHENDYLAQQALLLQQLIGDRRTKTLVAIELPYFHGGKMSVHAAQTIKSCGVAQAIGAAFAYKVQLITPRSIQAKVGGKSGCDKKDVREGLAVRLNLDRRKMRSMTAHETDAAACALLAAIRVDEEEENKRKEYEEDET